MLTVYKASAGSGKTFRLAVEYIKHLIVSQHSYEHILAVTFTNKATEEMKMRILSQLYGIAHRLKDSQPYIDVIMHDLQKQNTECPFTDKVIDQAFLAKRASMALQLLLHNYNFFRVETIDRFFQTVLRNLARELDLTPNLRVELSDKDIEYSAVDRWIDNLKESDRELGWILDYVRSSIDDDKSWNVIGKIKTFGENIFKDDYKAHSSDINEKLQDADQKFYTQYTSQLRKLIKDADEEFHELGQKFWDKITSYGLDETSFAQGARGIGGFLKKMSDDNVHVADIEMNNYVIKCLDSDDTEARNWVKKTTAQDIKDLCREVLRPAFITTAGRLSQLIVQARSARVTLSNLSQLRLLRAIQHEIETDNREQDRFLLSDTQTLLAQMIDDSDSPFIFEKIGSRLRNIMIDEFQDTSVVQWQNFKVLLRDCMSQGHDNLVVGDVKQSIYRWRSGDWRLLNNIENEFGSDQTNTVSLRVNRRSATRVIDFNNHFFQSAISHLSDSVSAQCGTDAAEMLRSAYGDVAQEYPDGKAASGFVSVELFEKDDYNEHTLQRIADIIISLTQQGVRQKDIAILVRVNKHIPTIARYCMDVFRNHADNAVRQLNIISDEAYLLDASPAVNIIVDALRLLHKPSDDIIHARLSTFYQRYVLHSEASLSDLIDKNLLPETFYAKISELRMMPLYQLCEELFVIFSLSSLTGQSAYVCCFFDCLTEHLQTSVGDIPSFLSYWDETMHKRKIESDIDNGIRILSIHKSKGLEFQTVVIPFCDWKLEMADTMWCKPTQQPYDQLPVIPLLGSQNTMRDTIYEPYYWDEHLQTEVDNINLLYVALTRAVDNLFIITQKGQKEAYRGSLIENILPDVSSILGMTADDNGCSYGQLVVKEDDGNKVSANVFTQPSISATVIPVTTTRAPEFRESNISKNFTLTDEQEDEQQRAQYIKLGNVLHYLFSNIRTTDDIDGALLQLEMDGMLYGQDITAEAIRQRIAKSMENPLVASWFAPGWKLYNECTILTYDASTAKYNEQRPDRVMTNGSETIVVDFKLFSLKDEYFSQVRRYMELLSQMGYPNVRGYLWQVFKNKITEVKLSGR